MRASNQTVQIVGQYNATCAHISRIYDTNLLLLLLLVTDICLRKLMYITNAHAVNSHEKILLSPEKKRFKKFFE